jgi:hypothetical protein
MLCAETVLPMTKDDGHDHDRHCLLAILRAFEHETISAFRRDLLRLAIDLFDVRLQMFGAAVVSDREQATLLDLIETIEQTDPRGKLYVARGLELKRQIEDYLAREAGATLEAEPADPRLQRLHLSLRERATLMLERFSTPQALAA